MIMWQIQARYSDYAIKLISEKAERRTIHLMELWILEYRFVDERFNMNAGSNGWTLSSRGYLPLVEHIRLINEDILKTDRHSYYAGQKVNWRLRSAAGGDLIPVEILI